MRLAWILGNGPTLPVEALGRLPGEFTVGVNRIHLTGFVPNVVMWSDPINEPPRSYQREVNRLRELGAIGITRKERAAKGSDCDYALDKCHPQKVPHPHPGQLALCGACGCTAARWALSLGFQRAALLGFGGGSLDTATHFYGLHEGSTPATLEMYDVQLRHLHETFGERVFHADDPTEWDSLMEGGWDRTNARAMVDAVLREAARLA